MIYNLLVLMTIAVAGFYLFTLPSGNKFKTIAVTGLDGSGKHTTVLKTAELLQKRGYKVVMGDFPMYGHWHCRLVEWYLHGKFGSNPHSVGPYIASMFYAIDRLFGYHLYLKKQCGDIDILIFDRYTPCSMIFQGTKFDDITKIMRFIKILEFIEYKIFRIPKPDNVIVLNIETDKCMDNMKSKKVDIHENSIMQNAARSILNIVYMKMKKYGWYMIDVLDIYGKMRTADDISTQLINIIIPSPYIFEDFNKRSNL